MDRIEPDFTPFADLSVTMVGVFFVLLSLLVMVSWHEKKTVRAIKTEYLPIYIGKRDIQKRITVFVTGQGAEFLGEKDLEKLLEGFPVSLINVDIEPVRDGDQGDVFCVGFVPDKHKVLKPAWKEPHLLISRIKRLWHVKKPSRWGMFIIILDSEGVNLASSIMKEALQENFVVSVSFLQKGWYFVYGCSLAGTIPVVNF